MRRRTNHSPARWAFLPVLLVALLGASPATAAIDNFVLEGFSAVGSFDLDDRIGKASGETEHVINIEDCEAYLGQKIEVSWKLSIAPADGDQYSVKVSEPDGSCPTDDLDDGADEDGCAAVYDTRTDVESSTNRFEVDLDTLTGGDCGAGTDHRGSVYIVYDYYVDDTVGHEVIDFDVDLDPPVAPTHVQAIPGESSISVTWDDDVNTEDGVKYRVYYRAAGGVASADTADGSEPSGVEASSHTIEGLESNTTYYFRVAAIDPNDNEGPLSSDMEVFTTTVPAEDFWEHYKAADGGDPGGFCFIATAAYGTPLASHVGLLRRFRDDVLMTTSFGRSLVALYYETSPPIARVVYQNRWLAALVRIVLLPLVFAAWFLLELSWLGQLTALLGLWLVGRVFRVARARRFRRPGPRMRLLPLTGPARGEEVAPC